MIVCTFGIISAFDAAAPGRYFARMAERQARLKLGVLVSGSGTNLQAILDAVAEGELDAEVRVVISNQPSAKALERAERAGVSTMVISHKEYKERAAFDEQLVRALREAGVDLVVLAGFMRVVTPVFLDAFPGRVVNIHPALLPSFPGVHSQRQALAHGVKVAGCTVHYVDAGTDSGPIIAQAAVPVLDGDTEESLSARILVEEHRLLVLVLQAIAHGRIEIVAGAAGERARVETHGLSAEWFVRSRADSPRGESRV
jgi:phosphoribosylglycinamide formyltransferase-1